MDGAEVVWAEERSRYELRQNGETLGFADVLRRDNEWIFPHVEVAPQHEGKGLGSQLVRAALEDAKRQGVQVVPLCPFVANYLAKHPQEG